jgi:hypothetical protein
MALLDRTALQAEHGAQRLGLDHETWLNGLLAAQEHYSLMPYELAEIEESSLAQDEACDTQEAAARPATPTR